MALMKISTYHKMLGDEVHFVKGISAEIDEQTWDRIYITTLFTFDYKIVVETIRHYLSIALDASSVYIGGALASLMSDQIISDTGIDSSHILKGLFIDTSVVGDSNDINVDELPLDYDILDESNYKYPTADSYFGYTTRGCPNKCAFCAVPKLEPSFKVTNNIANQVQAVNERYGPKQNLLLLDNNVLNAPNLSEIVDGICEAGFYKGARYNDPGDFLTILRRYKRGESGEALDRRMKCYLSQFKRRIKSEEALDRFLDIVIDSEDADDYREFILAHEEWLLPIVEKYRNKTSRARYVDFNQGLDARKIDDDSMSQLSRIALKPLRIAFDDIALKEIYIKAIRTAHRHGFIYFSNYILFNFKDSPADLYERLRINIELSQELNVSIFSFPMKFSPINRTDRNYIGKHWTKKYLNAVSAILQVTKGIVASGSDFFYKAFGKSTEEFYELLAMPRDFIMFRSLFERNGLTAEWQEAFRALSEEDKEDLIRLTSLNRSELDPSLASDRLKPIIEFYLMKYSDFE